MPASQSSGPSLSEASRSSWLKSSVEPSSELVAKREVPPAIGGPKFGHEARSQTVLSPSNWYSVSRPFHAVIEVSDMVSKA